ncbi:MAG TPA: DUF3826 domain-containing protein [Candidatus Binatia bacterium]|nr:DUF3826 domain-containing protein [Candidatus Binatia bacterium]
MSTPAATPAEIEAVYTSSIEGRADDILKALNLTDAAKSNQVHDIIIRQYRLLRARDVVIDARLAAEGKDNSYTNRAPEVQAESKVLHDYFLSQLSALLTPEQVDTIKDKLTYNKVEVTYNAYCAIIPGLKDSAKAKIMDLLKAAREEAIDGGSAPEKSAIFQKYKNQINDYLNASGYDVAQAYKDWEAKQKTASKSGGTQAN